MIEILVSFMLTPAGECTQANPSPAIVNSVCTGFGYPVGSCKVSNPACSPVPNTPGTWNPSGYTPKGYWDE